MKEWELEITFLGGAMDWDGVKAPTLEKAITKLRRRFVEDVTIREAGDGLGESNKVSLR